LEGRLVESGCFEETRHIVLFSAAPGIHLPRRAWNGEIFRRLGREIGKLHQGASRYEAQHGKAEHITDWSGSGEYQFLNSIPPGETLIRAAAQQVLREVQAIPRNGENYGILHGDIWLENVLVVGETLTLIDFQDCERHYYLYDLAVPLYSALEFSFAGQGNIKDYGQTLAENLLGGYLEEHTLEPEMLKYLPLLFRLKELFEYSQMHHCIDNEKLSEEQVRIFNLYRMRLEHNIPAVQLDYAPLFRLAASAQGMR
jgi:Ser/Thr protein kinase RdoA (MazF antagonist)